MFHTIRSNCKRASGGLSIFVKDTIPATELDVNVLKQMETMYVSVTPRRLPKSVSNIIFCGVLVQHLNMHLARMIFYCI